ncbi:MAG: hypothetical protein OSB10_09410 [Planctomycetota bacterium]|nr:hypothetical protein [Planctomycetota bacterium]
MARARAAQGRLPRRVEGNSILRHVSVVTAIEIAQTIATQKKPPKPGTDLAHTFLAIDLAIDLLLGLVRHRILSWLPVHSARRVAQFSRQAMTA